MCCVSLNEWVVLLMTLVLHSCHDLQYHIKMIIKFARKYDKNYLNDMYIYTTSSILSVQQELSVNY